jgi:hypothetical protein
MVERAGLDDLARFLGCNGSWLAGQLAKKGLEISPDGSVDREAVLRAMFGGNGTLALPGAAPVPAVVHSVAVESAPVERVKRSCAPDQEAVRMGRELAEELLGKDGFQVTRHLGKFGTLWVCQDEKSKRRFHLMTVFLVKPTTVTPSHIGHAIHWKAGTRWPALLLIHGIEALYLYSRNELRNGRPDSKMASGYCRLDEAHKYTAEKLRGLVDPQLVLGV